MQAVQGSKPAIITASRPITKMIVTQPKGMSSGAQATATKIIPTKIVYGQQGKTQVSRAAVRPGLWGRWSRLQLEPGSSSEHNPDTFALHLHSMFHYFSSVSIMG